MVTPLQSLVPDMTVPDVWVTGLSSDSRKTQPGDLFLALQGTRYDGQQFIADALEAGAAAVLSMSGQATSDDGAPIIEVPQLDQKVGIIADRFYGHPSSNMTVIAVTGTNGKTSVTYLAASALTFLERKVGLIGTLGQGLIGDLKPTDMTTPDALTLQSSLAEMDKRGADFVLIEASSHGLAQYRLNGTRIQAAVLTNLTRDHLDYHGDMSQYRSAKAKLFEWPSLNCALLNLDDAWGAELAERSTSAPALTFSVEKEQAAIYARRVIYNERGLSFELTTPVGSVAVMSTLMGSHNLSNLVAVGALLFWCGVDLERIGVALSHCTSPPGRLQGVQVGHRKALVDFAHTPDAVAQVLQAVRQHFKGRIICVLGCGGDRDPGKRPIMGRVAVTQSDICFFTSDNPRTEDPAAIIDAMCADLDKSLNEPFKLTDRRKALTAACALQQADDVLVVLGKGHESYQEVQGVRLPFDDRKILESLMSGEVPGDD